MKVKILDVNWRQVGSVQDREGSGDDYTRFQVGERGVVSIEENEPMGGNKLHHFLIEKEDGSFCKVFNPNYVEYFAPPKKHTDV